jgi:hypothetical protein
MYLYIHYTSAAGIPIFQIENVIVSWFGIERNEGIYSPISNRRKEID